MSGRWPWAVMLGATVLAFVTGIGAGLGPPTSAASPAATVRSASPQLRLPRTPVPDPVAALARPQRAGDVPGIPVGHRLKPSTFRVIDSSVLSTIYVARDIDGHICIVALPIDDQFAAACSPDRKRLRAPLLLYYTVIAPGQRPVEALAGIDTTG